MGAAGPPKHPLVMPNGVYPVPKSTPRPRLGLRLRVHLNRLPLDDRLAHGDGAASSDELALRAAQLLRERFKLAARIEGTLESAHRPTASFSAQAPVRRQDVRDCAEDLQALAHRLREAVPTDFRGIAMTSCLLTDGASPLYIDTGMSLRFAVRSARLALDPVGEAFEDVAVAA